MKSSIFSNFEIFIFSLIAKFLQIFRIFGIFWFFECFENLLFFNFLFSSLQFLNWIWFLSRPIPGLESGTRPKSGHKKRTLDLAWTSTLWPKSSARMVTVNYKAKTTYDKFISDFCLGLSQWTQLCLIRIHL